MAYHTHNSPSYSSMKTARKGQFFVLTTVAVVTILFFISKWMTPLTQFDTSSIVSAEEFFTFDNIKEKTSSAIKNSESCDEVDYNLQEYKSFIENFAREKNYKVTLTYVATPCMEDIGSVVELTLTIVSDKVNAEGTFAVTWP